MFCTQSKPLPDLTFAKQLPYRRTKQSTPLRAFNLSTKMRMATHSETAAPSDFDASRVSIPIDGQNQEYSALLLRDLCSCPKCVHESTAQRLYSTADVPSNIRAKAVDVTGSNPASLKITWENDAPGFDETHETYLNIDGLRDINRAGALSGPFQDTLASQSLWGAKDYHVPDTEFGDYMKDDAALYACMQQLRTHGLLFITKIPDDEQALVKIATRMGPMKDTFYGYTWDGKRGKHCVQVLNADLVSLHSPHCSFSHQRSLHLQRPGLPHGPVILPESTSRSAPPLHPVLIIWRRQRLL